MESRKEDALEGSALKFDRLAKFMRSLIDPITVSFTFLYRVISPFLPSPPDIQTASPKSVSLRNSFSSLPRDKSLLVLIIRFKRSVYTSCTPSYRVSKIQINFVPKHRAKGVVTTKARNSIPVVVVKISVPRRITRRLTVVTVGQEARLGEERYHPPFHGSFCEK